MAARADEAVAGLPATGRTAVIGFEPETDDISSVLLGNRLAEACQLDLVVAVAVRDRLVDVAAVRAGLDVDALHARWIKQAVDKLQFSLAGHFDPEFVRERSSVQAGPPEIVLAG